MDIDLLTKMVREAILDHDSVTLPGVGSFVAELVPSTFSDKGYTIHPPYRRLYFSPKQGTDTLLSDLYAEANQVDRDTASRILSEFLSEMKEVLKVRKTVVFPGLGRLRATRENHFFFVADEDLDIYPEGFGLGPVSLKTHEETPEEVATAVADLAGMMTEPVTDIEEVPEAQEIPDQVGNDETGPVVEEIPDQVGNDEPEPVPEPEPEPVPQAQREAFKETQRLEYEDRRRRQKLFKALRIALIVLGALLVLFLLFILLARAVPQWLDPLLYSREELEILRY